MKADFSAFVQAVIETGCNITAIGDDRYFFGDANLPSSHYERIEPVLMDIDRRFGSCDHLEKEIIAYLRAIGRHIPLR
ncbi:hypothetical protein [Bradyrhizobium sp.]|uniref:hypothetical protein n=1 Tax=Bradyrhizobium sp. TaxID=376 RepID=UPI0039E348A6